MRLGGSVVLALTLAAGFAIPLSGQEDPIKVLIDRLELERYKATVKGLTQFGDRRQGTERNRRAVDWIEAQLKSYGCPTERVQVRVPHTAAEPAGTRRRSGRRARRHTSPGRRTTARLQNPDRREH